MYFAGISDIFSDKRGIDDCSGNNWVTTRCLSMEQAQHKTDKQQAIEQAIGDAASGVRGRKATFVAEYLANGGNGYRAALLAGYSQPSARNTAWRLTNRDEKVKAAIAKGRAAIAEATAYKFDNAMQELAEGMEFARKTENATAFVRAAELRAKMNGHLVERREVQADFSLTDNRTDAELLERAKQLADEAGIELVIQDQRQPPGAALIAEVVADA